MTSKTRHLPLSLVAAAVFALALSGCATAADPAPSSAPSSSASTGAGADAETCEGVTVIVDTGDLDVADGPAGTTCVDTAEAIIGTDALAEAGITTEGTAAYPDDVICRVGGVPSEEAELPGPDGSPYHETCADMPPATAYWGLWVKPAGGTWDYAQTGLSALELQPGDSVELLFTIDGSPSAPQ